MQTHRTSRSLKLVAGLFLWMITLGFAGYVLKPWKGHLLVSATPWSDLQSVTESSEGLDIESLSQSETMTLEDALSMSPVPDGLPVAYHENEIATAPPTRPPVLHVSTRAGSVFGIPIAQFSDQSWVMRNDGAIQQIKREAIVDEQVLEIPFEPIDSHRLVEELRKEFGPKFQIRAEKPYVFVTRTSNGLQWASRFRSLYASIQQMCRTRGFATRTLDFPLIAIVMGSEEEFLQYARAQQADLPPNCAGYYSQRDNRIILFEDSKRLTKQETLDTICHEAAHQLAFNMGLHQRCSGAPLWLAEGFATMFEAPALAHPNAEGRSSWAASRQATWQILTKDTRRVHEVMDSMIRNDNVFKSDPESAYAVAWGLTHYLAMNHPNRFGEYLHQTSQLPPYVDFSAADRWEHFRRVFMMDTGKLAKQLQSHMQSL